MAGLRMLLIEDDKVDCMAFERFVKASDLPYEYQVATSCREAREILAGQNFEIIVSDYMLGDGTCLEMFELIGDTPVVVVTGTGDEETAVAAMKRGASDYLIKDPQGCYLKTLPVTVEKAMEQKRAERELRQYRLHLEDLVKQRTSALREEIIARTRSEQERLELQRQLHQAQKMEAIGQLAGGVAHDFNNLLTVIFASVDRIRNDLPENSAIKDSLKMIHEAAEQATGVTRSLLTFSRKMPAQKRTESLSEIVRKSSRLLKRLLSAAIELVVEVTDSTEYFIRADATQIQQVILNLAINARDAMPDGGTLRVALLPADDTGNQVGSAAVRLLVSDTGVGMSEQVKSRIFEPFFTTKPRETGTGLGLSIILGIVQDHEGAIEVQSQPGRGATFTVTFPLLAADSEKETIAADDACLQGHGECIMVAEDNEYVRQLVCSALESAGYQSREAVDGEDFLDQYQGHEEEFRLVLLDIDMPKVNGLECLNRVRSKKVDASVVLTTGRIDKELSKIADAHTFLLQKPFQMSDLLSIIGNSLKRQ